MDTPALDVARFLSRLALFDRLQPNELDGLVKGSYVRSFIRGQCVFKVGQPCSEFHVVIRGQIKLFVLSPQGNEKIIELAGPGTSFAEAVMFLEKPYFVSAQALTDTLLLTVTRQALIQEMENNPRLSMRMLAGLSLRLHGLVRDVEAYALQNGMERVIGYLLREQPYAQPVQGDSTKSVTVTLPVSKAVIASRLSMTPEYFSRVLHELESNGLIVVDRREITIVDPSRLTLLPTLENNAHETYSSCSPNSSPIFMKMLRQQ
jgi:CRP-like cAMP-binding protein